MSLHSRVVSKTHYSSDALWNDMTLHGSSRSQLKDGENERETDLVSTFLNIPSKCTSVFLIHFSILSLLHVSVCYVLHLQGEPLSICTKPSAFFCVLCCYIGSAIQYNIHTLVDTQFFFMIKTMFLLVILNATTLQYLYSKSFICNALTLSLPS
jgi:hypothetical protein